MLLKNKIALITGCNRGIGKKTLEVFSDHGASVIACVRKIDNEFKKFIYELSKKNENKITPIEIDFENLDTVQNVAKEILKQNSKIDILINNAGIIDTALFQMTTIKNLKKIFEINYFTQTIFTQMILKPMIKNKVGNIVYISSTSALDNNVGRNTYSATKASIISQAKTLSKEVGSKNIRVNVIAPGLTDTDMMKNNTPNSVLEEVISKLSIKRVGQTLEIANVALFLSSELSSYITGQTIRVDGGM